LNSLSSTSKSAHTALMICSILLRWASVNTLCYFVTKAK
jgi:hypothetical protein